MKLYKKFFNDNNDIIEGDYDLYLISLQESEEHVVDDFTLFMEAVIKPDVYVENLLNIFKENKNDFIGITHLDEFAWKFNSLYLNDRISMISTTHNNFDFFITSFIPKGNESHIHLIGKDLILNFKNNFNNFIKSLKKILLLSVTKKEILLRYEIKDIEKKILKWRNSKIKEYLETEYIIMVSSWRIVYEFKIAGKPNDVIKELLSKDSFIATKYSKIYQRYLELFDRKSNVLKLLYKYMYLYLE